MSGVNFYEMQKQDISNLLNVFGIDFCGRLCGQRHGS